MFIVQKFKKHNIIMSSSDSEYNTDNEPSTSAGCNRKKKYAQKYKKDWEKVTEFAGWIAPSKKGETYAFCKCCDKDINISSGRDALSRHLKSQQHLKISRSILTQPKITDQFKEKTTFSNHIKEGEIRLSAFIAEHNLPYTIMEHLPKLLSKICIDSKIAQELQCSRSKCQSIVEKVIGQESFEQLCADLKENKFSLIIDESTDLSTTKHLCLVVRYVKHDRIRDSFLTLLAVTSTTAVVLHETIVSFFIKNEIPYTENMIGFGADGANVMMGAHNSVMALLKKDIPNLFVMKCICHSYHLCASYACEKLPLFVEDFIRDVYNFFSNSPNRKADLKEFQMFCDLKVHKLLHPSQTRWLSVHAAVKRVLEQYSALRLYFIDATQNNNALLAAENILQKMNDKVTLLFLQFLDFVLPIFNKLNKEMQAENPRIHILYSRITETLMTLYDNFINKNYLSYTVIENVDFTNPRNFKPINDLYCGASVVDTILKGGLSSEQLQFFKLRCLDFYLEASKQITARFPLKNNILKELIAISPHSVKSRTCESIVPICRHFPNLVNDLQTVDTEWRELRNFNSFPSEAEDAEAFWYFINKIKLADGTPKFPHLCKFVFNILALPHSSANVERIFSAVNLIKTKQRNRLSTSSIEGLLLTKQYLDKASCYDFKVEKKMLTAMSKARWYE